MTTYCAVGIVCGSIIKRVSVCPIKSIDSSSGGCWVFASERAGSRYRLIAAAVCWLCEFYLTVWRSNIHKHPFNGPFSGTTRVNRYQKGKTNLDFTKPRDSEWQWHQLGHMQVCTSLRLPCQHSTTHYFTGWMPSLLPNQQHPSTEGIWRSNILVHYIHELFCIVL